MLPAHIKNAKYGSQHNDNNSPFLTEAFHGLANHLAHKNSISALHGFVLTTSGVNSAMCDYPYLDILHQNLRLTPKNSGILSSSHKGHHVQVWGTELFTRILMGLPEEARNAIKVPLQDLAQCLAAELSNVFRKTHICEVYSSQYLAYVRKKIDDHLKHSCVELPIIDEHVIARESLGILDDMAGYFTSTKHRRLFLLLSFFGTNCDTDSDLYSSKILKEVLHYSQKTSLSTKQNLNPHEEHCRKQIFTAIQKAIKCISTDLEKAQAFVASNFPWYCIIKKLRQMFYALFTIPVLTHIFHTVKETDSAYKDSIMFGDCLEFFSSLQEIETTLSCHIKYASTLFSSLREIKHTYTVEPHSDYVASVRSCTTGYRTSPICSATSANCNKLQHKIRAGFSAMHSTASSGSNVVAKAFARIRNKVSSPKTHLSAITAESCHIPSAGESLHVSRLSAAHTRPHYNSECTVASNDNDCRYSKRSKRKLPSWRKHLLKKAHKLLSPRLSTFLHSKKLRTYTGMYRAMSISALQSHYSTATDLIQSKGKKPLHDLAENGANSFGDDTQHLGKTPSCSSISSMSTDEALSDAPLYKPALQPVNSPSVRTKKKGKKLGFLMKKGKKKSCSKGTAVCATANDSIAKGGVTAQETTATEHSDAGYNNVFQDTKKSKKVSALRRLLRKTTKTKEIAM
ncbi:hypothetical protein [Candidatus Anaplasma sp. TIGMIC]|uniref:hypothetical protein n=1 Tax=Candidatus Anaplasma sp. TIGMIC TaxID=3020713 RepID=UPI00232B05D6|nr:hypothetical protein [Candidatus Anaplasma sp. TIGMIC]MDB1135579.1 hypothetical protein [Candidatus Anaplasma sp. TIGMIC]